jgi:hypothetical protein
VAWWRAWACAALILAACSLAMVPDTARAISATPVPADQDRIEITSFGDLYESRGDSLQIETAAGLDGVPGRMSVRAVTPGTNPNWVVFALSNPGDKPIERWITAERYSAVGPA